jgi:hypothetical protein
MAVRVYQNGSVLDSAVTGFSVPATSPNTVMAWIRMDDATPWANRTSISGVYLSGATAVQLGVYSTNQFGVWTWGGGALVLSTGFAQPVGVWNHFAYTYDGAGNNALYINGVLNNTGVATQLAGTMNQAYINGFPTGGTQESGNTSVDDFIIFNRQLTLPEIQTIYNAGGLRDGIFNGVAARYTYDEGTIGANVVAGMDLSINKATMTPTVSTPQPIYTISPVASNIRRLQG